MKIGLYLSSWAFFDKVPLNDILKIVVRNLSWNFANSYLRDMSQQVIICFNWAQSLLPKKDVGGQEFRPLMLKKTGNLQSPTYIYMIKVINTLEICS